MSMLQELDNQQIDLALADATQRNVPVTLTIKRDDGWVNLHSRLVEIRAGHVLMEMPIADDNQAPHEFVPAEKVGISFKLRHYKHVFTGTVAGVEQLSLQDQTRIPVLAICSPSRMQRIQRRAYTRADVPPNRIVRASFWLGGRDAEPTGPSSQRPVWFGKVVNISAGGFQLRAGLELADALEVGESVGIRISFGNGKDDSVFADAQFRHAEPCDTGLLLGFQFIGLDHNPAGRQALQVISTKVCDFHRIMEQAAKRQGYAQYQALLKTDSTQPDDHSSAD